MQILHVWTRGFAILFLFGLGWELKPPSRVHKWKRISMFQKKGAIASNLRKCHNKLTSAVFRLNPALLLSHELTSPKFSVYLMSAKTSKEHLVSPARTSRVSFSRSRRRWRRGAQSTLTWHGLLPSCSDAALTTSNYFSPLDLWGQNRWAFYNYCSRIAWRGEGGRKRAGAAC